LPAASVRLIRVDLCSATLLGQVRVVNSFGVIALQAYMVGWSGVKAKTASISYARQIWRDDNGSCSGEY
jgi:hypothetical protein